MVKPIPNQPINRIVQEFKAAEFQGDVERMNTMFDTLLWQFKRVRKINKGKTQRLANKITELKKKLSEVNLK